MPLHLRETVRGFTTEHLLDQYFRHANEYTPEAMACMKQEIDARNVAAETVDRYRPVPGTEQVAGRPGRELSPEDFIRFEHAFSYADVLLVTAMLREEDIPFYIENSSVSGALPLESQVSRGFVLHVGRQQEEQARRLIDGHFDRHENGYRIRYDDLYDRLKAFNFQEVRLDEAELEETAQVDFSGEELRHIQAYARRLEEEIDRIEQERVVFHFDNIGRLLETLAIGGACEITKTDMLTLIEIFQIYCREPQFPESLRDTIEALLDIFTPVR